jgi:maltose alpha-D-glucosyltransferase/alpha-amylase
VTPERLREQILLPYLRTRRWFAAKGRRVLELGFAEAIEWVTPEGSWLMAFLAASLEQAPPQRYFFPLSIGWEARNYDPAETLGAWSFARVRYKDRVGIAYGAFGNPKFALAVAHAIEKGAEITLGAGRLCFLPTSAYPHGLEIGEAQVKVPQLEQSNTSIFLGNRMHLKGYRLMHAGINPEVEVGRFLTEVSPYPHIARLFGTLEYVKANGEVETLASLQEFIPNQGDLWTYTLEYLERFLSTPPADGGAKAAEAMPAHASYLQQSFKLGRRIGELHAAFAVGCGDPAFSPAPVGPDWLDACKRTVHADTDATLDRLAHDLPQLPESLRARAQAGVDLREALSRRIDDLSADVTGMEITRHHGDLHLGQILLVKDEFVIIDFEGAPHQPIEERRRKHSPLRDVAGMLRSFVYAVHSTLERMSTLANGAPNRALDVLEQWERLVSDAFLQGYREATAQIASVPRDAQSMQALIELFTLERTLYELRYELDNRPELIGVPLRGLSESVPG